MSSVISSVDDRWRDDAELAVLHDAADLAVVDVGAVVGEVMRHEPDESSSAHSWVQRQRP